MAGIIKFANREVCDLVFLDYATKKPYLYVDFANATTQEITGDSVYATGGQGAPKRVVFYDAPGGTLSIETQMLTGKLFALMTGAGVTSTAKFIKRLELTAASNALTIPDSVTFVDGTVDVYAADDDCGTPIEVTVSGSTITLPESSTGNFIVYGMENISTGVERYAITSKTFPKDMIIYGETVMKGEDGTLYPYKLTAYKAAPQRNFSLGMSSSGDPTSVTLTFDLLADSDDNVFDMLLMDGE